MLGMSKLYHFGKSDENDLLNSTLNKIKEIKCFRKLRKSIFILQEKAKK